MSFFHNISLVFSIFVVFVAFLIAYPQPTMDWNARADDIRRFYDENSSESTSFPLRNKVIVITGATSGIGKSLALRLAQLGANIVAIGRSPAKLEDLRVQIPNIQTYQVDQSDLKSVVEMANNLSEYVERIDILINNAGIHDGTFNRDGTAATVEGYDAVFAVNYQSHVLVTEKLMPLLLASPKPILLQTSSLFHWAVNGTSLITPHGTEPAASLPGGGHNRWVFRSQRSYAISKLAQIYHARAIQKRYPKVRAVSFCPNFVGTNITRKYPQLVQKVIAMIGFPLEGYALSSAFDAMFVPDGGDFYSNSYIYDVFSTIFAKHTMYEKLADSMRDELSNALAGIAIVLQKFFPRRGSTLTSPQSYNTTIEGALYLWSLGQLSSYLTPNSS